MSINSQETDTAKRGVRFSPRVSVRPTQHLDNVTDAEKTACWYTAIDYRKMHKRERRLVRGLEGKQRDEDIFSTSGIESDELKAQRRVRARQALLCVLIEQEQQWNANGQPEPEKLAKISCILTRKSSKAARYRGIRMAEQVWSQVRQELAIMAQAQRQFPLPTPTDKLMGVECSTAKSISTGSSHHQRRRGGLSLSPIKKQTSPRQRTISPFRGGGQRVVVMPSHRLGAEHAPATSLVMPRR